MSAKTQVSSSKKSGKTSSPEASEKQVTKEDLEKQVMQLQEEVNKAWEERINYELDVHMINTFWGITRDQMTDAVAAGKNHDKAIEGQYERHQKELMTLHRKMASISNEPSQSRIPTSDGMNIAPSEGSKKESFGDFVFSSKLDEEVGKTVEELKKKYSENVAKTRELWEEQLREIQTKYDKELEYLKRIITNEIKKRHEQWKSHICILETQHEKIFTEATALLKGNMRQEVHMNDELKADVEYMREKLKKSKQELADILQDNQGLLKLRKETDEIRKKIRIPIVRENLREDVIQRKLHTERQKIKTLKQRLSKVQEERDEVNRAFEQTIHAAQYDADQRITVLEQQLQDLMERLGKTPRETICPPTVVERTAPGCVITQTEEMSEIPIRNVTVKLKDVRIM